MLAIVGTRRHKGLGPDTPVHMLVINHLQITLQATSMAATINSNLVMTTLLIMRSILNLQMEPAQQQLHNHQQKHLHHSLKRPHPPCLLGRSQQPTHSSITQHPTLQQ